MGWWCHVHAASFSAVPTSCHAELRRAVSFHTLPTVQNMPLLRRYCQRLSKTDFWGGAQLLNERSCTQYPKLLRVQARPSEMLTACPLSLLRSWAWPV